jgi:tetraacyldisaccharide 4'-kinase
LDQNRYRRLISDQTDGFNVKLFRSLLKTASYPYKAAIAARNFLYDRGYFRSYRAPVPVISIGNITAGGTGKTPITIWLCNKLIENNYKTAVLTRGYKMQKQMLSDEPAVINENCPDVKIVINPDRVAGAVRAIREFGARVLVMDDGFSHRRLKRDLDIIAIDSTCPFGYAKMLPAGLLREPLQSLKRAHAAILTRCDLAGRSQLNKIEEQILAINPDITLARTVHLPTSARLANGEEITINELAGKKVFVFCGIGNPDAFLAQLDDLKLNITGHRVFNDHHQYIQEDITDICEEARYLKADILLTTQKDWVKIAPLKLLEMPFAYLVVKLSFLSQEDKILTLVEKTVNRN